MPVLQRPRAAGEPGAGGLLCHAPRRAQRSEALLAHAEQLRLRGRRWCHGARRRLLLPVPRRCSPALEPFVSHVRVDVVRATCLTVATIMLSLSTSARVKMC